MTQTSHIPRYARNVEGRDFAVGDIHGQFSALQSALNAVGFNPKHDRLFSVGDMVDRGPESHLVLNWLDQPWFFAIMGNHEYMALRWASGNPMPLGYLEYGGDWLAEQDSVFQHKLVERFSLLPLACEVETTNGIVGLVHADCPYDDWSRMHETELTIDDLTDTRRGTADFCIWSSDRYRFKYEGIITNVHAVAHGHTTLRKPAKLGNVFFIDTAQSDGAGFTLLNLNSLSATHCNPPHS